MSWIYTKPYWNASINDITASLNTVYSSSKTEALLDEKVDKIDWIENNFLSIWLNWEIKDSWKKSNDFSNSWHTHSATSMQIDTTNFWWLLDNTITDVQKLADFLDDNIDENWWHNIQDEWISLTKRDNLNFKWNWVTVTDNSITNSTDVNINIDKTLVWLWNVDNTSDVNKPISTATQTALNNKVDKVTWKSLINDTDITKLAWIEAWAEVNNISDTNATDLTDWWDTTLHTHDWRYYTETETNSLLSGKQNTLTAWTNITIVWDTISSTWWATTLDELTDVTITTPANWQALTYNWTIWVNTTPAGWWDMLKSENLSWLTNYATARENLGLEIWVDILAQRTFWDIVDSDIADFAPALTYDENYVTDAEKIVIWNTSWTNSWDNATNSQYSWLATSKQDTLVSWTNIKSINWQSLLWAWDIEITSWWLTYSAINSSQAITNWNYYWVTCTGDIILTLADWTSSGQNLSIKKLDNTAYTITITGNIEWETSIIMDTQYESLDLFWNWNYYLIK